jgi:hypothetical protein
VPRAFGGNLDNKELVAGTTLFLPVLAEGARDVDLAVALRAVAVAAGKERALGEDRQEEGGAGHQCRGGSRSRSRRSSA